jgi:5-methylcytosine-specific restriction protein A
MRYRDRGCCFPGCCRPVKQCEAHHMRPWDDGGPTDLENGCMLCYAHHRLVHELRWTITRRPDGGIDWHKPDRSYHATWHPPGRPPPIRLL